MPRHTEAYDAWRSYSPEEDLIGAKDFDALTFKYEAKCHTSTLLSERVLALVAPGAYRRKSPEQSTNRRIIDFDGACLEIGSPSPIAGYDPRTGVELQSKSRDASILHVEHLRGPQHLREQLAVTADYIASRPKLRATPYVLGVTYAEMARLGVLVGMRPMDIQSINTLIESEIRAWHALTFADSQRQRSCIPSAVYLPTEEFVHRFAAQPEYVN